MKYFIYFWLVTFARQTEEEMDLPHCNLSVLPKYWWAERATKQLNSQHIFFDHHPITRPTLSFKDHLCTKWTVWTTVPYFVATKKGSGLILCSWKILALKHKFSTGWHSSSSSINSSQIWLKRWLPHFGLASATMGSSLDDCHFVPRTTVYWELDWDHQIVALYLLPWLAAQPWENCF